MQIGELANQTGVTTKTIRYYEDIGVLPQPDRSPNGYRSYTDDSVSRLGFVRDAQAAGLTLVEIASVLELRSQGERTCGHVTDLLVHHLESLDVQIKQLRDTRKELVRLIDRADVLDPADCTDPARCQTIIERPRATRRRRRFVSHHSH